MKITDSSKVLEDKDLGLDRVSAQPSRKGLENCSFKVVGGEWKPTSPQEEKGRRLEPLFNNYYKAVVLSYHKLDTLPQV